MRLILSSKGMDSSYGGFPSAILPDGSLCSFPIPEPGPDAAIKGTPALRIRTGDTTVGALLSQLTRGRISPDTLAHLDPDLDPRGVGRQPGWLSRLWTERPPPKAIWYRPGSGRATCSLFFGWFRRSVLVDGQLRFEKGAPDIHVLYGWLQIGQRISLARGEPAAPSWVLEHPHCKGSTYASSRTRSTSPRSISIFLALPRNDCRGRQRLALLFQSSSHRAQRESQRLALAGLFPSLENRFPR